MSSTTTSSAGPPSARGRSGRARPCSRPRTAAAPRATPSAGGRAAGASSSTASSTTTACTSAAIGERAPERTLVAVRAIAPVAAKPPKKGATTLPMPCAISSASGSCLRPVMPSATTAESSDSIAPSIAIAKAAGSSSRTSAKERPIGRPSGPGSVQGRSGSGGSGGIPWPTIAAHAVLEAARDRRDLEARHEPGGERRGHGARRRARRAAPGRGASAAARAAARRASAGRSRGRASAPSGSASAIAWTRSTKCSGISRDREPEQVLELQRGDHDRDAGGEARGHRDRARTR